MIYRHILLKLLAYKTVLHSYGLDSNPESTEEEENSDLELMEVRLVIVFSF